jgi:hypothetical protein
MVHKVDESFVLQETSLGLNGLPAYFTNCFFGLPISGSLAFGNVALCCVLVLVSFATGVAGA